MTYRAWNLKTLDRTAVRELTHAIAEQNTEELEYHSQSEEPWTEAQYNATLAAQQKETALLAGILAARGITDPTEALTLLAGEEGTRSGAWDEPDGPRLAVTAASPQKPWVEGAFEFAKAGFALLAERYPDNVSFADLSGRGEQSMVDLQLFASEGGDAAAPSAPALSHAQAQQAIASGTMKADEGREASDVPTPAAVQEPEERPAPPERPAPLPLPPIPGLREGANTVRALHARWAAEEAMLRRDMPDFSLKQELANPEMRRLMELPGMRMGDAYRLAHYNDALRQTAQTVEQGVVERIRQRSARPAENGTSPGGAAITRADVASMTRAQREALERHAMHGVKISF